MSIKTLAMLKMEKNFRAHIEKGYPRQPYKYYGTAFWVYRLHQELVELQQAFNLKDFFGMRDELADLSNCIDYCFERTLMEESDKELKQFPQDAGLSQLFEHNKRLKETEVDKNVL